MFMLKSKPLSTIQYVSDTIPLEKRLNRSNYFKQEYPESVPIYLQFVDDSYRTSRLHRYVVPRDNSYGHLLLAFRRKIKLRSTVGMISIIERVIINSDTGQSTIDGNMITTSTKIGELADKYLQEDGFLYINIIPENTFG